MVNKMHPVLQIIHKALVTGFQIGENGKAYHPGPIHAQGWTGLSRSELVSLRTNKPSEHNETVSLESADGYILLEVSANKLGLSAFCYEAVEYTDEDIRRLAIADDYCDGLICALLLRYGVTYRKVRDRDAKARKELAERITARLPESEVV